jgi:hypothetical protein
MALTTTAPQQIPLNLDIVTGRMVSNQLGSWIYGALPVPVSEAITSGTSSTIPDSTPVVYVNPASVIAAYTLTMPADPQDGDVQEIAFGGTIADAAAVITALTLSPNTGQTIYGAAVANPVNGGVVLQYRYSTSLSRWTRLQ